LPLPMSKLLTGMRENHLFKERVHGEADSKLVVQVQCYSGHIYAQRPKSFLWLNREYEILKVEREWQEPGKRIFKVLTGDERAFELCYNEVQGQWSAIELVT